MESRVGLAQGSEDEIKEGQGEQLYHVGGEMWDDKDGSLGRRGFDSGFGGQFA